MAKRTRFVPGKFKPVPKVGDQTTNKFAPAAPPGIIISHNPRYKNSVLVLESDGSLGTYLRSFLERA